MKKETINKAIALLQGKGDSVSMLQVDILTHRRTEEWIFNHYVREKGGTEEQYYAARDAARFLYGSISLEEFIPDADQYVSILDAPAELPSKSLTQQDRDSVTIKRATLENILARLNRLERIVGIRKVDTKFSCKKLNTSTPHDLISQAELIRELGVNKNTIKRWLDSGYIVGYINGARVGYSRSQVFSSRVVKEHITTKSMII